MKRVVRKNQMIITALAIMIAVAGYLNYSGKMFTDRDESAEASNELVNQELLDISEEDLETSTEDILSQDTEVDGEIEGTPGEAILTSGAASAIVAEAKVTREQVRAKNKESLMEIIDSENLSEAQKQEAVNQMVRMTEIAEKEAAAETLMASKGFSEAVVNMTEDSVDVVVNAKELSDSNRAQIEDIITRKTGIAPQNIVITPVYSEQEEK